MRIENDISVTGGGFANLVLDQPIRDSATGLAIWSNSLQLYLHPGGKAGVERHIFDVQRLDALTLRLGPHIVNHVLEGDRVRFEFADGTVAGELLWTDVQRGITDDAPWPTFKPDKSVADAKPGPAASSSPQTKRLDPEAIRAQGASRLGSDRSVNTPSSPEYGVGRRWQSAGLLIGACGMLLILAALGYLLLDPLISLWDGGRANGSAETRLTEAFRCADQSYACSIESTCFKGLGTVLAPVPALHAQATERLRRAMHACEQVSRAIAELKACASRPQCNLAACKASYEAVVAGPDRTAQAADVSAIEAEAEARCGEPREFERLTSCAGSQPCNFDACIVAYERAVKQDLRAPRSDAIRGLRTRSQQNCTASRPPPEVPSAQPKVRPGLYTVQRKYIDPPQIERSKALCEPQEFRLRVRSDGEVSWEDKEHEVRITKWIGRIDAVSGQLRVGPEGLTTVEFGAPRSYGGTAAGEFRLGAELPMEFEPCGKGTIKPLRLVGD